MWFALYLTLISYSFGNSSSCLDKVSLYLNFPKNVLYTYNNTATATIWSNDGEKFIKNKNIKFKSISHPMDKTAEGYDVYEVIVGDTDSALMEFLGLPPAKLPWYSFYALYPSGKIEGNPKASPTIIRSIGCGQVFSTSERLESSDGWLILEKEALNKVVNFESRKVGKTKIKLIRLESRKQVLLKGKVNGKGTETITTYLVSGTGELFEETRKFKYEYRTGFGLKRRTEYVSGEYIKKLDKKEPYSRHIPYFPDLSDKKKNVSYFTDKDGLFIPVMLNEDMSVKMFIDPLLESSFMDYEYYIKAYDGEPKDYLYPFDKMNIGGNIIAYPSVLIKKVAPGTRTSYKIPGIIGSDVLSKGAIYINDKKRLLSFYEPEGAKPKNAISFEIDKGLPVFDVLVNNSPVKATISFGNSEPVISARLKDLLSLKTREIAVSKSTCESCFIKKAELIIAPPGWTYFKTEAVIGDLEGKPYDLVLGLEYIKDKEITINYQDLWFSIN